MKVINKDFKFNDGKEHCRVFCKGFKKDISRDEIMKIFEPIGTIVDIRLPETREVSFLRWENTGLGIGRGDSMILTFDVPARRN